MNLISFFNSAAGGNIIQLFMAVVTLITLIFAIFNTKATLKAEKESRFRESRPYFILSKNCDILRHGNPENKGDRRNRIYATSTDYKDKKLINKNKEIMRNFRINKTPVKTLSVNNVSQKSIIALQIILQKNEDREVFKIALVPKETQLFLVPQEVLDRKAFNYNCKVIMYFTNELREKEMLVFKIENDEITYDISKKKLENKGNKFNNDEYDVAGFTETERLHF